MSKKLATSHSPLATDLNQRILQLARLREEKKAALDAARGELAAIDEQIIPLVAKHGAYPPKATRTKVLSADDGTELRVTTSQEIRVDGSLALRLRAYLREQLRADSPSRVFRKLFRRVDSYVLAEGAHECVAQLPRSSGLRATIVKLFNAAISEEDKTPAVEVRRPEKRREET